MRFERKKRLNEVVELNITAFMDLMVSLICFLLITAVFSQMSVVELNLPKLNAKAQANQEVKLSLQLVVREKSFDIRDENLGLIKQIARDPQKPDWKIFTKTLLEIKYRFPETQSIALLLEPGVNYRAMIEVMDHVKTTDVVNAGTLDTVELFPNISIGDAPVISSSESASEIEPAPDVQDTAGEKK